MLGVAKWGQQRRASVECEGPSLSPGCRPSPGTDFLVRDRPAAPALLGSAFSPLTDQGGQDIEVRPHEKGLARSIPVVAIVAVDHGPYRPDADGYRVGNEVAELGA